MEKSKARAKNVEGQVYSLEEVRQHVDRGSLWVIYGGDVYDVTEFIHEHPGGGDAVLSAGGQDLSLFWEKYQIHYRKVTKIRLAVGCIATCNRRTC